jgi:hypothetical protein
MSLAAVKWARSRQIDDQHAEAILLAIAFRANDEGWCFWRAKQLARISGVSVREVREKIRLSRKVRLLFSYYTAEGGYLFILPVERGVFGAAWRT